MTDRNTYTMTQQQRLAKEFGQLSGRHESDKKKYHLTRQQIEAIEKIANGGDRAEIIPVKDGLKIMRVRREEAKA